MTFGSEGARASAPIDAIGSASNSGSQVTPAFRVRHTPPSPAPKENVAGSPGAPAPASTRPPRGGPMRGQRSGPYALGGVVWGRAGPAARERRGREPSRQ